ncbi:MAG TPA: SGNH family hydrolase [Methylocella sp.]|nr:SGNH family hydrolase [Methylocella sp.]
MARPFPFRSCLRLLLVARRAVILLGLAVGFAPFVSGEAVAQVNPFTWFQELFRPSPNRIAKPGPEPYGNDAQSHVERPKSAAKRTARKPPDKPEKPHVAPAFFVVVLGDSLGQMLAQGLTEAFENRPEVAILRKAKQDTGLVRDDFYDWTKATEDLLASNDKIDFAVMLIGSNDRQPLHDATGSHDPDSPEWKDAYTHRIETIAGQFRDKKIPLVWVGLPILKSERLAAGALSQNQLYRDFAEKAGATYLDIWETFADEAGQYSVTGPDLNGQIVKLRAADGIHFTKAGARKLASFVEPAIRHRLDEVLPRIEPDLPAGQPATPPGEATPSQQNVSTSAPGEASPPPKPIAGPVLPLTTPSLDPSGELATGAKAAAADGRSAQNFIDETLQQGQPVPPKPGRADDFSWPRP